MIIMALNYICLLLIFVLLQTGGDGQRVVTAPGNCLRDSECDKRSEYCSLNHRCHTRQSENAGCLWNKACDYGLYCRGKTTGSGVCKRQKGLFEKCDRNDVESCAVNGNVRYMCSPETNRCVRTGFEGDVCIWNGDCQSEYYCKTMHLTLSGRCRKRLPEGAKCGLNDDYDDCQGVCSHGSADHLLPSERSKHSVCVTASTLGEACTESRHCRGHVDDNQGPRFDRNRYRVSPVICNIPKGDIGICEHAHKLIKKEGLKCNPSKDRCEARRGLSCGKTPTGPRCMFNVFDDDKYARPFCDINGKFSRCNNHDGIPTECREGSAIDILHSSIYEYSTEFDESFRCHRKREIVPQGSPCSHVSYAVCEKGTTCRTIPAIQGNYYKNPTTQFCVAMKNEGEECFSKFHYACNDGLKCHNNMCVKGNPDAIITHADFNGRCDLLPCIPHFKCLHTNGSTYGYCVLKNIAKSKGLCFDTALKTYSCKNGTVCVRSENGSGFRACRKRFDVGAICSEDSQCMAHLRCGGWRVHRLGRCYNPKLTPPLGRKCNPYSTKPAQKCVDELGNLLKCLPKEGGYACHKMVDIYERCDIGRNIACSNPSKAFCNHLGVCVPRRSRRS